MSNNLEKKVWLVGIGAMGIEYSRVLIAQNIPFCPIGRGLASADKYQSSTGITPITGGVKKALEKSLYPPEFAIVAVNVESLFETSMSLIEYGVKKILIEKPASLTYEEVFELNETAQRKSAKVFIAYNRRFFASTIEAKRLIEIDGGAKSFSFDFTEWSHKIEKLQKPKEVFENWFFANSTHVIDLAFYLGGKPICMNSYVSGKMEWYPRAVVFVGSGMCSNGSLFSYNSNWQSAGRWRVEIKTTENSYILCPLETLKVQKRGSLDIIDFPVDDKNDKAFKPGLFLEVKHFIENETTEMLALEEHCKMIEYYKRMEGSK